MSAVRAGDGTGARRPRPRTGPRARLLTALMCGLVLSLGVSGCHHSEAVTQLPRPSASPGKHLTVGVVGSLRGLDPAAVRTLPRWALLANVLQTPLTVQTGGSIPQPDATECEFMSPVTYSCSLVNDKTTFANGHRLGAADIIFSITRAKRLAARAGVTVFPTLKAMAQRGSSVGGDDGATRGQRNAETVVFTLTRADATFPYQLTQPAAAIVDRRTYPADRTESDAAIVGSGPYRISRLDASRAVLVRNVTYHGARRSENDQLTVLAYPAGSGLASAFRAGRVDVAVGPAVTMTPAVLKAAAARVGSTVSTGQPDVLHAWTFALGGPSGRHTAVRQATAQLIDRQAVVRRLGPTRSRAATSLVPDTMTSHIPAYTTAQNKPGSSAVALLRAAGLKAPVPLTLGWVSSSAVNPWAADNAAAAAVLAASLRRGGLFRVTLRPVPDATHLRADVAAHRLDLVADTVSPSTYDANAFLQPFLQPGASAWRGYRSTTVTKLLTTEQTAQNEPARVAALQSLQTQAASDVPAFPLWQSGSVAVVAKGVGGIEDALTANYLRLGAFTQ